MKTLSAFLATLVGCAGLPGVSLGQIVFHETAGVVSLEAEHASRNTGGWTREADESASGGAYMKAERRRAKGSKIEFPIRFQTTGWYRVWLRATCTSDGDNDCYVWLDGKKGSVPTDGGWQEVAGIKTDHKRWDWASVAKTEGHTPRSLRAKGAWVHVTTAGLHTLQLGSRSKDFKIDKVLLQAEGKTRRPRGEGPPETLARAAPPARRVTYVEAGGVVSIEAEHFTTNEGYTVHADDGPGGEKRGFSGRGWVSSSDTTAKRLDYEIAFTKTGAYYVHMRTWASHHMNNGFHLEFDGKRISGHGVYVKKRKRWGWYTHEHSSPSPYTIRFTVETAGKHTFSVTRREKEAYLDKIVLHDGQYGTDGKGKLSGNGPPATIAGTPAKRVERRRSFAKPLSAQIRQPRVKKAPLQPFAAALKPIRAAQRAGRYDESLTLARELMAKTDAQHPARPALALFAQALQDARDLRHKIVAGVAAGRRLHAFVNVAGRSRRVKLLRASTREITVAFRGSEMPVQWHALSPAEFAGVASRYVDPGSAAEHVALARYCAVNGLAKRSRDHAVKALALDPDLRGQIAALLALKDG